MAVRPAHILSLCAGYGGLDLALGLCLRHARTVCYVEREVTAAQVLAAAMEAGHLHAAPVWSDLATFDGRAWRGRVHILAAGYPCQPFSLAGKRGGSSDERHLFPQVERIIGEVLPPLVFLENVSGHVGNGLEEVLESLQALGYRFEVGLFTAKEVGAPHRRERVFVLAYREGLRRDEGRTQPAWILGGSDATLGGGEMGDAGSARLARRSRQYGDVGPERSSAERAGGVSLPDPQRRRRGRGPEIPQRSLVERDALERYSGDMADAPCRDDQSGQRLIRIPGTNGQKGREGINRLPDPSLFPPGPTDLDAWSRVPAEAQPCVRGLVDERTSRVDQLRMLGNGVCVLQAAYSFSTLAARILEKASRGE